MEPSENRRQSEPLPSMMYREFERTQREGAQFQQRHPSVARGSISTASPISPTTLRPPTLTFPSSSAHCSNGYISPPESRRTSNEDGERQSLPSLSEALLYDKLEKPGSFAAPSPMHTPPLGQGSFSNASAPHPPPMPRSQPAEALPSVQPPPPSSVSQIYHAPPPPPAPSAGPPPGPVHHHESYDHRQSQDHGRTLPSNPYSQAQAPPPIPAIRPPDSYPPPGPNSYQSHPYPAPPPPSSHHNSPPQYPPTPSYHSGGQSNQYPFPPHAPPQQQHPPQPQPQPQPQSQLQPQSQSQPQPPYTPQPASQQPYSYPPPDQPYSNHENAPSVQTSPGSNGGLKRNSYGSTIEKALSISSIRRELDSTKEHSARIYHLVQGYQDSMQGGPMGGPMGLASLDSSLRFFEEALEYSQRIADALHDTRRALQEWSVKAHAEQDAQKMNTNHIPEYGGEDTHGYAEDTRSNGLQQPDAKKIRRGRAAPPGRCHSCQRAETPEWRRGPDGARTLCNACGLHYAKLTRKLSKNAMGSVGGALGGGRKPNSPLP